MDPRVDHCGVSPASGLLGGDLLGRLERFAADARVDEDAGRRSRERWLRQQSDEEATLHGVLVDLAERMVDVTVHTRASRSHHGRIRAVGTDFCGLRTTTGRDVVIAVGVITSVRTQPREQPASGDRPLQLALRLADVLSQLAAERERVLLVPAHGGDGIAGELRSLGHDVLVVRLDGAPPGTAYVPLATVGEVALVR